MLVLRLCMVVLCLFIKAQGQTIVIDEFMADPSPPVQLPNSEFIELKNASSTPIDLYRYKITDGSSTAIISVSYVLQPDSFIVVCPAAAVQAFSRAVPVSSFPSLNNDADIISLYSPDGALIHSIAYSNTWYQNAVKSEGGWSLEMIDTKNACAGMNNWKASTDASGGTPGRKNSVDAINTDDQPPALVRTYTIDSITIAAVFDEPLDNTTASNASNYQINGQALTAMRSGMEVILTLPRALQPDSVYLLTVNNVSDCSGNAIGQLNTAKAGLPTSPHDIIINEVFFNPPSGGYDYIELYNRGKSVIDLKQLSPTSRNPYLLFPGQYIVLTENKQWVQQHFLVKDPSTIVECPGLPSMPDDKGDIKLLDAHGNVVDELHYDEKWHFALLETREGVSLERINYNQPTNDKSNWTSAASTAGFGTPGAANSQLRADLQAQGQVTIVPTVFSPGNEFTIIQCQAPGYIANISIYDAHGYRVRLLVQQATLAATADFRWDGLGDKQNRLPTGNYIVVVELFNLQGKTKKIKRVITLAGR